jgi:hypothetical protein
LSLSFKHSYSSQLAFPLRQCSSNASTQRTTIHLVSEMIGVTGSRTQAAKKEFAEYYLRSDMIGAVGHDHGANVR